MGIWKQLRNLLGGEAKDDGIYLYVRLYKVPGRPSPDDEIVQIRLNPRNDISTNDDGERYVRKIAVGSKTFRRAEIVVYFDTNHRPQRSEIDNGELVGKKDYDAYLAKTRS